MRRTRNDKTVEILVQLPGPGCCGGRGAAQMSVLMRAITWIFRGIAGRVFPDGPLIP